MPDDSKHDPFRAYGAWRPAVASPGSIDPRAAIVGRVSAGAGLEMRAYAVLRADGEHVRIGGNAFFGERATVHIADSKLAATIADDVSVGRFSVVHACSVGRGTVVGDAAVVLDDAAIGERAYIAPGALVPPRKKLDGGFVYEGHPASPVREITPAELAELAARMRSAADEAAPLFALSHGRPAQRADGASEHAVYIAPNAVIEGDVHLGDRAGVYFSCRVDAGDGRIAIGERTNIQDNSILVTDHARGALEIGAGVTVGHNVCIGAGVIGDDALIGIGSSLGDGVVVEKGACVAARAVVEPGTVVRAGWIWAGRPARAFREVKAAERAEFDRGRDVYIRYGAVYLGRAA